ncbi:hypothetical protein Bbelb_133440 [Branchiostoma belcheri]|nr:hypothetical protein Bbelb_133440 [Branchiostoma belcheri]
MRTSYTNNVEREVCKRWRGSVVLKVRQTGGVVVDWYAIDIGEGDVTFAQLYERLVAASEYRPDRRPFQSGHHTFERNGSCVEVTFKFGCFVRVVVDKTATTKAKDCQQKSAFERNCSVSEHHPVCQVCKATRVEERTRVKRKLERKGSREEEDGPLTFRWGEKTAKEEAAKEEAVKEDET